MKKLTFLFVTLLAFAVSSCGGYDEKTTERLIDRYNDSEELSSDDIATAIDQCNGMIDIIEAKLEEIKEMVDGTDSQAEKAIDMLDEFQDGDNDVQINLGKLAAALDGCDRRDLIKGDNKKEYKELQRRLEKVGRLYEKAKKATRRAERRLYDD